jgi:hypothetical protein
MLPHGYGSVPRRQIPDQGVGRDSVEPVLKSQVSRFKFQAGCAVAAEVTRRTQGEFPDQGVERDSVEPGGKFPVPRFRFATPIRRKERRSPPEMVTQTEYEYRPSG